MGEALVVNAFLTLRVLLVGGFLLALPRVTRRGLLFGAYVGEDLVDGSPARALARSWDRGCLIAMGSSLLVGYGISLTGRPVAGNLTGTALLLTAALWLYVRHYSKARRLAPEGGTRPAELATASLGAASPSGERVAKAALGVCLVASLATVVYATASYPRMPPLVPDGFGAVGGSAQLSPKSVITILFAPTLNLVLSPFFALLALLTAGAKRSVRGGSGGGSAEAQESFRTSMAKLLSGTALFICAVLIVLSAHIVQTALGRPGFLWLFVALCVGMILFTLANLIWILRVSGQGGARRESATPESPLTGGLADNAHWVLGMFYVDRDDPSIMVEKRFGVGYSLNYGNRSAADRDRAVRDRLLTRERHRRREPVRRAVSKQRRPSPATNVRRGPSVREAPRTPMRARRRERCPRSPSPCRSAPTWPRRPEVFPGAPSTREWSKTPSLHGPAVCSGFPLWSYLCTEPRPFSSMCSEP